MQSTASDHIHPFNYICNFVITERSKTIIDSDENDVLIHEIVWMYVSLIHLKASGVNVENNG